MRDARPFVAHHLRQRADQLAERNGSALHLLARWVENLPARDPRMTRIEKTEALGYDDGAFTGGPESEALIDAWVAEDNAGRDDWLEEYAAAVARFWS
ncbi:MAG: hypothetical protein M3Q30_08950 [Actinomycetota bacterium]|nr:hypothetical protein [Actinomycetota bacterium]